MTFTLYPLGETFGTAVVNQAPAKSRRVLARQGRASILSLAPLRCAVSGAADSRWSVICADPPAGLAGIVLAAAP